MIINKIESDCVHKILWSIANQPGNDIFGDIYYNEVDLSRWLKVFLFFVNTVNAFLITMVISKSKMEQQQQQQHTHTHTHTHTNIHL